MADSKIGSLLSGSMVGRFKIKIGSKSDRNRRSAGRLQCGFADQSHFTHAFTAAVGASPGVWWRSIQL